MVNPKIKARKKRMPERLKTAVPVVFAASPGMIISRDEYGRNTWYGDIGGTFHEIHGIPHGVPFEVQNLEAYNIYNEMVSLADACTRLCNDPA
jgi:hypothetical protein